MKAESQEHNSDLLKEATKFKGHNATGDLQPVIEHHS